MQKNKQDTLTTVFMLTTADSTVVTGLLTAGELNRLVAL